MAGPEVVEAVHQQVRAFQGTDPAAAQAAGRWLAEFQQSQAATAACSQLLLSGLKQGDQALAFFAAQTLAARARLVSPGEDRTPWKSTIEMILNALQGGFCQSDQISAPVLKQLAITIARLAVQVLDVWENPVRAILNALEQSLEHARPLLEVLQALAEEPFSKRVLMHASLRSRFLLYLREQVSPILTAISNAGRRLPELAKNGYSAASIKQLGVQSLHCSAAWLRALPGFEEWLPMIAFGGGGASENHPALTILTPFFVEVAIPAARLEFGPEAFEGAGSLLEAAIDLVSQDLSSNNSVTPLLGAFLEFSERLSVQFLDEQVKCMDLSTALGVLLSIFNAAFQSSIVLCCAPIRKKMLEAAGKFVVLTGTQGDGDLDCDGGLLGRTLDLWEAPVRTLKPLQEDGDFGGPGPQVSPDVVPLAVAEEILTESFRVFLEAFPLGIRLPPNLQAIPDGWDLSRLRGRISQLCLVWCDGCEARLHELIMALGSMCERINLQVLDPRGGSPWSDLDVFMSYGTAVAECLASRADMADESDDLPMPFKTTLEVLPGLPIQQAPPPWRAILEVGAAELVAAADPFITLARFAPSSDRGRRLLEWTFSLATGPGGSAAGAEALTVVVSNLAPALAQNRELAQLACSGLRRLCLCDPSLSIAARERLVKGAVAPLLSQLEVSEMRTGVEGLASELRAAAPPNCPEETPTPQKSMATRLLFQLLASVDTPNPEMPLEWISQAWPCLEAALLRPTTDAASESACLALSTAIAKARGKPIAREALLKATPILTGASARGNAPALAALGTLVRSYRGFADDSDLSRSVASEMASLVRHLIPGDNPGQLHQLPPDLLAALLELLAVALGARKQALAAELFRIQGLLPAVAVPLTSALHAYANPRVVCWGLLFSERLLPWGAEAGPVVQPLLAPIAEACCRTLASSPVSQDKEVLDAMAKLLLSMRKHHGGSAVPALQQGASKLGIPREELELLCSQLGDPNVEESSFAEALAETASSWQVEDVRRSLAASH